MRPQCVLPQPFAFPANVFPAHVFPGPCVPVLCVPWPLRSLALAFTGLCVPIPCVPVLYVSRPCGPSPVCSRPREGNIEGKSELWPTMPSQMGQGHRDNCPTLVYRLGSWPMSSLKAWEIVVAQNSVHSRLS